MTHAGSKMFHVSYLKSYTSHSVWCRTVPLAVEGTRRDGYPDAIVEHSRQISIN